MKKTIIKILSVLVLIFFSIEVYYYIRSHKTLNLYVQNQSNENVGMDLMVKINSIVVYKRDFEGYESIPVSLGNSMSFGFHTIEVTSVQGNIHLSKEVFVPPVAWVIINSWEDETEIIYSMRPVLLD